MTTLMLILFAIVAILILSLAWRGRKFEFGPIQKEWIAYLKAHPEEQLKSHLGRIIDGKERCCCLGRGGIIAGVCEWNNDVLITNPGKNPDLLHENTYKALGLRTTSGGPTKGDSLAYHNDIGRTWPEIAKILEKHPRRYFTCSK